MTLAEKLRKSKAKQRSSRRQQQLQGPVWRGPEVDGVSQSLLSRYLCCKERFRLLVVEGLKPADTFNHRLEYGSMWHAAEEAFADGVITMPTPKWEHSLRSYCALLCRKYPLQQEQVEHWYHVCKVQFPIYIDYWEKHKNVKQRTPLLQEQVFDVPYVLPSGRTVRLRGKWDSVDLIGKGKAAGVYLQENKTKGDINEEQLRRQLGFDLQTMLYIVALNRAEELGKAMDDMNAPKVGIRGVRYNVVRRPLSGGKGSIRQHRPSKSKPQGESKEEFYARLGGIIEEDPGYYFMRWKVEISSEDIKKFKREFLNPCLEGLCDWWSWVSSGDPWSYRKTGDRYEGMGVVEEGVENCLHYRLPYGIYNVLVEGGSSELDEYLATGSELGLERTTELFPELV